MPFPSNAPGSWTNDESVSDTVDIYDHLRQMNAFVGSGRWNALEASFRDRCAALAGTEQADRIAALDFPAYEARLRVAYAEAVDRFAASGATSLYFEYDLDDDWRSGFFFCEDYRPESERDDEWACEFTDDMPGPSFEAASSVYREHRFDRTDRAKGSTLYLIARTVAAFGRCFSAHPCEARAVCMGFHDQDPVQRIYESS